MISRLPVYQATAHSNVPALPEDGVILLEGVDVAGGRQRTSLHFLLPYLKPKFHGSPSVASAHIPTLCPDSIFHATHLTPLPCTSASLTHLECHLLAPPRSCQAHRGVQPLVSPHLHPCMHASAEHFLSACSVLILGRYRVPEIRTAWSLALRSSRKRSTRNSYGQS